MVLRGKGRKEGESIGGYGGYTQVYQILSKMSSDTPPCVWDVRPWKEARASLGCPPHLVLPTLCPSLNYTFIL